MKQQKKTKSEKKQVASIECRVNRWHLANIDYPAGRVYHLAGTVRLSFPCRSQNEGTARPEEQRDTRGGRKRPDAIHWMTQPRSWPLKSARCTSLSIKSSSSILKIKYFIFYDF